ncbi:MAG: competence protein ComEA [Solirubrobacterales bacterium]|jgi:competence protein ComEA|nr:competence protein ComEA [Solirubrobacterales bacterium]
MPELSRSQLLVYGAIAVALLLLGARWLRSADNAEAGFGGVAGAADRPSVELDRGGGGIVVHVAGEVRKPGVYELAAGSRVTDAVERAGGPTAAASPDAINLAAKLADGQQVVMPSEAVNGAVTGAVSEDAPISLGTATVEQLDTIEGIGPVTAADIVEYRDQHGGLSSIDELDQMSGIGPATMEALRARLQP